MTNLIPAPLFCGPDAAVCCGACESWQDCDRQTPHRADPPADAVTLRPLLCPSCGWDDHRPAPC
jgi:hypothetical protein